MNSSIEIILPSILIALYNIEKIEIQNIQQIDAVDFGANVTDVILGFTIDKTNPNFKLLKDWYDLNWNNETGQNSYKTKKVGQMVIEKFDKTGSIYQKIICVNAFPRDIDYIGESVRIEFMIDFITVNYC